MATAYKTQDEWIKEKAAGLKSQEDAEVAASAGIYNTQAQNAQNIYNKNITDTKTSYEDMLKTNEVQKFLNARAVERRAAEMGLTDSGLNRTQQTAVQLSAANNAAKITRQQQAAIDTLAAALSADLATINANKAAAEQSIRKDYSDKAYTRGTALFSEQQQRISDEAIAKTNAEKEISLATIKAMEENEPETPVTYSFTGATKTDENGNTVNVYRGSDGKEYTALQGYNIYTGTNNNLTYAAEAKDPNIGFFSNGYQPKGLVSEGGKFKKVTAGGNILNYEVNGKTQSIWQARSRKYFVWDGYKNAYEEVPEDFVKQVAAQRGLTLDDLWKESFKSTTVSPKGKTARDINSNKQKTISDINKELENWKGVK